MSITRTMFELGIDHQELAEHQERIHAILDHSRELAFTREEIVKLLNEKFQGQYKTKRKQAIAYYALEELVKAGAVEERYVRSREDFYYAYRADLPAAV